MPEPLVTDLLGAQEAATAIGIERSTVTRWIEKGWLVPAQRLGGPNGALVFTRAEIERAAAWHKARLAGPQGATA